MSRRCALLGELSSVFVRFPFVFAGELSRRGAARERFLELLAASARDAVLAQLRPVLAPAWLATAATESEELL